MKHFSKALVSLILIISMLFSIISCDNSGGALQPGEQGGTENQTPDFYINGENRYILSPGDRVTLTLTIPEDTEGEVDWTSSHSCVSVDNGVITVLSYGTAVVKATIGDYTDSVIILVPGMDSDDNGTDDDTTGDTTGGNADDTTGGNPDDTTGGNPDDTTVSNPDDTTGVNPDDTTGNNPDDTTDDTTDNGFASGYNPLTVAEALEMAEQYTSSSSTDRYYVVATVKEITGASNGSMYVYDTTGTIYVYNATMLDGSKVSSSSLTKGDVVLIGGTLRNYKGTLEIDFATIIDFYTPDAPLDSNDPYANVDVEEFYSDYKPATSYEDAYYRTLHNLMSGTIAPQDQAPTLSAYQPTVSGSFIRNSEMLYSEDGNVYFVVDAYGNVVMEIYKGAAYIMLEEVAAHVFAFGEPPANQTSSKDASPTSSEWGIYLRLNHTSFSGSTSKYPYEPELPNISGCGGTLNYYEMDIGTTGTDCDPSYTAALYNNGSTITRGAARIVYACEDDDGNGTIDYDERYVFYTYNHYNDFQEYLNYYGGWGEMFGNITGGGTISSKSDYNPTPYVPTVCKELTSEAQAVSVIYYYDVRKYWLIAA